MSKINGILIDCGRASRRTMGTLFPPYYEIGFAPFNRTQFPDG